MEVVADLHLHGKYSRAVSKQMVIPEMVKWARIKGLDLLAAPDWTHPQFLKELKRDLSEVEDGVYAYRRDNRGPRFILSTEIASIYKQDGRGRRIHNLLMVPSFAVADKVVSALKRRGANLASDGRPIIGLSARQLAELVFGIDKDCLLIPAHIWTPWYSLFGSRSGFESVDECFGRLANKIYGIETGISSDPLMNWGISQLDNRSILSFSDAHSPANMGREATVFKIKNKKSKIKNKVKANYSYADIAGAIKQDGKSLWQIDRTIEFYPEEGKYHFSGHRRCGVAHSPHESKKLGLTCPVCGKILTMGVAYRVSQLQDKEAFLRSIKVVKDENGVRHLGYSSRPSFTTLIPLLEIISESLKVGVKSKTVYKEYINLTNNFKDELSILLKAKIDDLRRFSSKKTAEGIARVRAGNLHIDPGYDGLYGKVSIWFKSQDQHRPAKQNRQLNFLEG